jgi:hypothetical protein
MLASFISYLTVCKEKILQAPVYGYLLFKLLDMESHL